MALGQLEEGCAIASLPSLQEEILQGGTSTPRVMRLMGQRYVVSFLPCVYGYNLTVGIDNRLIVGTLGGGWKETTYHLVLTCVKRRTTVTAMLTIPYRSSTCTSI